MRLDLALALTLSTAVGFGLAAHAAKPPTSNERHDRETQQIAKLALRTRQVLARGPAQSPRKPPKIGWSTGPTQTKRVRAERHDPLHPKKIDTPHSMEISGHSPEHQGVTGQTLTVFGHGLPKNGVDVYVGGTKLERLHSSATEIVVRLPASPTTGALRAELLSTGKMSQPLDDSYSVVSGPSPSVFSYFDIEAGGHHSVNAYLLSVLSWYAYDTTVGQSTSQGWQTEVQTRLVDFGLEHVDCFDANTTLFSTQGCVAGNDALVVVFFRGTQTNGQDWGTDVSAVPVARPAWGDGVRVHAGFDGAVTAVWPELEASVKAMSTQGQPVWVTGHSLGGALATVAAFRLEHTASVEVHGVYTYGAPGVGNGAFRTAYTARSINHQRYTQARDLIPALPPSVASSKGYAHVGNLVHMTTAGTVDPSSTLEPALSDDLGITPFHYAYPSILRDAVSPASVRDAMPAVP